MSAGPGGSGPRSSPLARFLGAAAAGRGPFAMLGVAFADAPDDAVMAALQRRLLMVDAHPESMTPQADEVRLALHAAAAQLLDPKVRRVLAERWGVRPGWHAGKVPAAAAGSERGALLARMELERDAVLSLAMHGGWNSRALRHLTMMAHSRGVPSAAVAEVLRGMARRPARAERAEGAPPRPYVPAGRGGEDRVTTQLSARLDERASLKSVMETIAPDIESERLLRRVLIFGGVAVLALAGAIGAVIVLTSLLAPRPGVAPGPVAAAPPTGGASSSGPAELFPAPDPERKAATKPTRPAPGPVVKDGPAIARDLAAAVEGLDVDAAAALQKFDAAAAAFSKDWGGYADDQLRAAQDAVIEFIYRAAARPEVLQRAVEAVRGPARALRPGSAVPGPGQVWSSAWSLGMLTRLEAEKDLPTAARLDVQAELQASAPGRSAEAEAGFSDGVWVAISLMPRLMIPPARPVAGDGGGEAQAPAAVDGDDVTARPGPVMEAWREWAAVVKAASAANPQRGSRSLLVALETVMTMGPEPAAGNDIAEIIGLLTERLGWRQDDESRSWLVRWLSAPGVSSQDLHALTEALVSRASAPGVDATMVLAPTAGDGQRQELRDRFARAWALADLGDRADAVAEWAKVCREQFAAAERASTLSGHLSGTVVFSRLNQAAQMIWLGEAGAARGVVEGATDGVDLAGEIETPREGRLGEGGDDAGWAVKYIQVDRNIPDRLALLTARAQGGGSVGLVEGALIASEAVRGAPESVRRSARDLVRRFASDPAMINGLLEEASTIPITTDNAQLIRSVASVNLPSLSDPYWREAVRRALVERLLETLAAQGELGVIDRLTELLSESYQERAREGSAPASTTAAPGASKSPVASADESVRVLRLRWQASASAAIPSGREPFSPDQIVRRYAARAALADGMVQRFAADQAALCEYVAYVVATEQPAQAEAVGDVLTRLGEARRKARTIMEQTHAVERAMTELWLIRLEGGAA
ncbi:MAG: hypothetical protein IT436_06915 [Phycisphaerales bacterium]|nr:hypothetical protein [Phycisphaerales bacterium]